MKTQKETRPNNTKYVDIVVIYANRILLDSAMRLGPHERDTWQVLLQNLLYKTERETVLVNIILQ